MENQSQKQSSGSLPYFIWRADELQQAEQRATQTLGVSLYDLMLRAGNAVYQLARHNYPSSRHWLILCGHGNNGGDGYVVARLAAQAGIKVTLICCEGMHSVAFPAVEARQAWLDTGGNILASTSRWPEDIDLIVDALLGTGVKTAPRDNYAALIKSANASRLPIVAIDIPSGLMADSGSVPGVAINATHTMTFLAPKPGLLTGLGRDHVGKLHYDALGLSDWLAQQYYSISRITVQHLATWLRPRRPCANKGEYGRLLLIGGDRGFGGAIRMAAEAALRSGAGLVRVLTHQDNIVATLCARPELMVQKWDKKTLSEAIDWADVIVVGPGLAMRDWGKNIINILQSVDKPTLWDADALNILALNPNKRQNRIITPHPGEAARLLRCTIPDIESDRLLAAKKLVDKYGGVVVLKGAGTLIVQQEEQEIAIADVGNAGMASGGMGDVLSGIIGGLLAQKLALYHAACAGCVVHGAVADNIAAKQGMRGLLATDLLPLIPYYVNPS